MDFVALGCSDYRLGKMIQRGVFSEEAFKYRAQQKDATAFKRLFFECDCHLDSAGYPHARTIFHTAHHGSGFDLTHAIDTTHNGRVAGIGEER